MMLLLESSLYATAVEPPTGPFFSPFMILFLVGMGALLALAAWLLATSNSGPGGLFEKGLRLSTEGRYAEAEQCFRKGLEADPKPPQRRRLLICLGGALMDLDRFPEARGRLEAALPLGDASGSCRSSLVDWFLMQGGDPRQALEWAEQIIQASTDGLGELTSAGWIGQHLATLVRAQYWSQRAWALARLGRQPESQETIDFALKLAIPSCAALKQRGDYKVPVASAASRNLAEIYWRTGMALLAMGQTGKAGEHFGISIGSASGGKAAERSRQQLERLGVSAG